MLEAGNGDIDLIFCGDDIGSQRALLMSLDTFEANIKPYHLQLNEMIHRHGAKVVYDGDAADISTAEWTTWTIGLAAVGGNLSNVTSLAIGVEGAGAAGVVYIDDVRVGS